MTQARASVHAVAASDALIPFLGGHEGFVSKTYRCPAGVPTIGYGFTMGSRVFAEYWTRSRGRALAMGDRITRAEADAVLAQLVAAEYAPPVRNALPGLLQNEFDGSTSVGYNCGSGALKWKWAQALGRGDVGEAVQLLKTTAIKANGRTLPGLVRRRRDEALLIQQGDYGNQATATPAESTTGADVRWYQQALATLKFYAGPVDGIAGIRTHAAVAAFQKANELTADGIVGPATRAALVRALDARLANQSAVGSGAAGGMVEGGTDIVTPPATAPAAPDPSAALPDPSALPPVDPATDASVALVVVAALVVGLAVWGGFWLWRNRGRFTGRRVPT